MTWNIPSDAQVQQLLADRIDRDRRGVGMAVGIIEPAGRRTVVHGVLDQESRWPVAGDSIFEIGAIAKVYTGLLLADMVARGEAALTEPVAALLDPAMSVPAWGDRKITLVDLATHTSGLPRLLPPMAADELPSPDGGYTAVQLEEGLAAIQLSRDVGAAYEYSNLGFALLAHALSQRAGRDHEALVMARIVEPLGMSRTGLRRLPAHRASAARGHDAELVAVPEGAVQVSAGAGALRSSVDDQLSFLAAHLALQASPLGPAMRAMREPRRSTGIPGVDIALGWHVLNLESEIFWHNGGADGFRSFMGLDLQRQVGVVVLSNASSDIGVDDIGLHLLRPHRPLASPPKRPAGASAPQNAFDERLRKNGPKIPL